MSKVLVYIEDQEWFKFNEGEEALGYSRALVNGNFMQILISDKELLSFRTKVKTGTSYFEYTVKKEK